ncbi:MAG: hypothetical protein QM503_01405, partial [Bacteroidota bacterium]
VIVIVISIILLIIIVLIYLKNSSNTVTIVGPVSFTYFQKNDSTVPNIIVFDYNVENIVADSFFIVESTNDYKRKQLNVKKGQMTSAYFNPGNYEAFLVADDSIIKKLNIEILSNSWVAMITYTSLPKNVPFYFYEADIINNDKLGITKNMIDDSKFNITDKLQLTLSNTFNCSLTSNNDFTFKTKIKLQSVRITESCPRIYLGLLFEHDLCYIPLIYNGGQDKLQLKYGSTYQTSNDSDLSGFGCNIYEWQEIKLVSTDSMINISLNNTIVTTLIDSTNMGKFRGFSFTFDGIGMVDYISMITHKRDTIYYNTFQ